MRLASVLVASSVLFAANPAEAYLCTAVPNSSPVLSQAWVDRCLPYFINDEGALFDGEARRSLIAQSFGVWSNPTCTDVNFVDLGYTTQAPGFDPRKNDNQNVIISIEDEDQAAAFFTRRELAITITAFNTATGEIFDADILLNTANFVFAEVDDTAGCRGQEPMAYDLRNTLVHEMGHFIGFEHDNDSESTMFPSAPTCETKKRDLTQDNISGVCTVYATGQFVNTCAPPDTYDIGPGNPSDFRNQCDRHRLRGGCTSTGATTGGDISWMILVLGALALARRRASGR